MDAEEKLLALKKAYADIILNISKEAAARVMATERKAARYQHELKVAKEEGLRMLMRLKGMMDSKVTEAQAESLNQQNKIDLLEAQLQEAEDIVKDLREELSETRSELDRAKNEKIPTNNGSNNFGPQEIAAPENEFCSYQPSIIYPPKSDDFDVTTHTAVVYPSERYEYNPCYSNWNHQDLPSIILRGKDRGLFRNGCTQRIRACDSLLKECSTTTDNLKDTIKETELSHSKDMKDKIKETELTQDKDICIAPPKSPTRPQKKLSAGANTRRKRTARRSFRDYLSNEEPIIQMDCADELSEKEKNLVEVDIVKNMPMDDELIEKMESPTRGEIDKRVLDLNSPVCEVDAEVVNDDVLLCDLEAMNSVTCEGFNRQPARDRVIKYTFQRKRKRGALGESNENASTIGPENREGDKKTDDLNPEELPKSGSLEESSSRGSRRLAQVARQLISMSGRKW